MHASGGDLAVTPEDQMIGRRNKQLAIAKKGTASVPPPPPVYSNATHTECSDGEESDERDVDRLLHEWFMAQGAREVSIPQSAYAYATPQIGEWHQRQLSRSTERVYITEY